MAEEPVITLTFAGTGSALCDWRMNANNNAVLWTDRGPLLLDCGGTLPFELSQLEIPDDSLVGILITHVHGDHINGIHALCNSRWTSASHPHQRTPIYAVSDVFDRLRLILKCVFTDLSYEEVVDEHILYDGKSFDLGGFTFIPHRVLHGQGEKVDKPAYCIQIKRASLEILFSGDCEFSSNLHSRFLDSVIVFHDCMMNDHYKGSVHAHYNKLKELPLPERGRTVLMGTNRPPDHALVTGDGFRGIAKRRTSYIISPSSFEETCCLKPISTIPFLPILVAPEVAYPTGDLELTLCSSYQQPVSSFPDVGVLLWTTKGPFLIGCGISIPQTLAELGVCVHDLEGVAVPGIHSSHCMGLEQIMWGRHYTPPFFMNSRNYHEKRSVYCPTHLYGPSKILKQLHTVMDPIVEGYTNPAGDLIPIEIDDVVFQPHSGTEFDLLGYHLVFEMDGEETKTITIRSNASNKSVTIYYSGPLVSLPEHTLIPPRHSLIASLLSLSPDQSKNLILMRSLTDPSWNTSFSSCPFPWRFAEIGTILSY